MKVEYLIRILHQFNPEAEVRLNDYNGESALFVSARSNDNNVVWIYGEDDTCMKDELTTRFQRFAEKNMGLYHLYKSLLIDGITVDMVRKHMGDDVANNMEDFCKNNGLL